MVSAHELKKSYGTLLAVDGVSLDIAAGETLGLLGPNGAGKTTTINMLVGILRPDSGTISIDGVDDPTRSDVRNKLGNAPQSLALYDDLTAAENLDFFGKLYGLSGNHLSDRIDYCLELAGLTDRRNDRAKTFSGGMQRRLNLACAIVHDPPVLLLDEPTVGVDPQSRNLIFERIERIKSAGKTVVYTTHYMEEAQRLCDRVAIIDHGQILALDTVDALIRDHGGESVIHAELSEPPANADKLPGELDGLTLRIQTSRPLEEISRLAGLGIRFQQLRVDQADLESVFLNLTGRSLRDK